MTRDQVKPSPLRQKRLKFYPQPGDPDVIPPGHHVELAGHHWLLVRDSDGHVFGYISLQWQPGARRWCHSHQYATGRNYDVEGYEYVAPCPIPPSPDDLGKLREFIATMDEQEQTGTTLTIPAETWSGLRRILYPLIP